jgi:hypothetical protein
MSRFDAVVAVVLWIGLWVLSLPAIELGREASTTSLTVLYIFATYNIILLLKTFYWMKTFFNPK